jgi:hypothetical protein
MNRQLQRTTAQDRPPLRLISLMLVVLLAVIGQAYALQDKKPAGPNAPRAAYERFKTLEGKWQGKSTKGWDEAITFKTIAGGSVVVENSFDAHPNETMMTMYHLDGDRLLLTHYCVAKNQPRLLATSFSDDGRTITFTFQDGTNLPSRNRGHMDKVVYKFGDDNHFTAQWTWYQDGAEKWLEEINYERSK